MVKQARPESRTRESELVLGLADAGDAGPDMVGSKAANLAQLLNAGFPVPEGSVLTTRAFERWHSNAGSAPGGAGEEDTPPGLPPAIVKALARVIDEIGDVPLAVRSSAVAEDLPDASYAGQYETVLGVRGLDELQSAVLHCWTSAFNERVAGYRRARGEDGASPVAVVIQRLVEADSAGVAFTVNPVTGDRDETLVSAVRGLGERLVSGESIPDEWAVRGDRVEARQTPENSLSASQVLRIAELARSVEAHFNAPQDIEWAIVEDQLFLLQARQITGLNQIVPVKPDVVVPPGFWRRDAGHYPRPMSPITRSFYLEAHSRAMTASFREFGVMIDRVEAREIGGYIYLRIVPPGGKEGPAPPWWLLGVVARVLPSIRAILKRARDAERSGLGPALIERWWSTWRDELASRIRSLRHVDLSSLPDNDLDTHITECLSLLQNGDTIHFRLFVPFMRAVADLVFFCRDVLGWETRQTMELVSGLSTMSTEPARRLGLLADMVRERPAVLKALHRSDDDLPERLHEIDPEFAEEFYAYQREFGPRSLGEDVMEPTLGERPSITLSLLRGQLDSDYDAEATSRDLTERRHRLAEEARQALNGRPDELRRFEEVLERAERAYPVREDDSFLTYQAPIGLIRYAVLELGKRLADRGGIAQPDDVMFLDLSVARSALRDGRDLTSLVDRARGEYAWSLENPGPATYGEDPGPPPDMRALPVEVRNLMESLLWFIENDLETHPIEGDGLRGTGASPGEYRGPARVILSEDEFHKLEPGDVLVCPITSPVWSVLFANAGALVTDSGGVLSHSAIIAREYGIPAVVATVNATSMLRDGQIVTVDGGAGTVRVDGID